MNTARGYRVTCHTCWRDGHNSLTCGKTPGFFCDCGKSISPNSDRCRRCAYALLTGRPKPRRACMKGHVFTPETTIRHARARRCRVCRDERRA